MDSFEFSEHVSAEAFLDLAQAVWPRDWYEIGRIRGALGCTTNIGAFEHRRLIGCVRVLTDGYLFATVPEILVHPDYQRRGIGRELMARALAVTPRGGLFFGAQPQSIGFFERIGAQRGPVGFVLRATGSIRFRGEIGMR